MGALQRSLTTTGHDSHLGAAAHGIGGPHSHPVAPHHLPQHHHPSNPHSDYALNITRRRPTKQVPHPLTINEPAFDGARKFYNKSAADDKQSSIAGLDAVPFPTTSLRVPAATALFTTSSTGQDPVLPSSAYDSGSDTGFSIRSMTDEPSLSTSASMDGLSTPMPPLPHKPASVESLLDQRPYRSMINLLAVLLAAYLLLSISKTNLMYGRYIEFTFFWELMRGFQDMCITWMFCCMLAFSMLLIVRIAPRLPLWLERSIFGTCAGTIVLVPWFRRASLSEYSFIMRASLCLQICVLIMKMTSFYLIGSKVKHLQRDMCTPDPSGNGMVCRRDVNDVVERWALGIPKTTSKRRRNNLKRQNSRAANAAASGGKSSSSNSNNTNTANTNSLNTSINNSAPVSPSSPVSAASTVSAHSSSQSTSIPFKSISSTVAASSPPHPPSSSSTTQSKTIPGILNSSSSSSSSSQSPPTVVVRPPSRLRSSITLPALPAMPALPSLPTSPPPVLADVLESITEFFKPVDPIRESIPGEEDSYLFQDSRYDVAFYLTNDDAGDRDYHFTFCNYFAFLCYPTLTYERSFPLNPKRNYYFLFRETLVFLFVCSAIYFMMYYHVQPALQASLHLDLTHAILQLMLPSLLLWMLIFYAVFHNFTNIIAEITRFSDREFYLAWWNVDSLSDFWRTWSRPVFKWMCRHVFIGFQQYLGKTRSAILTFAVTALFHEYILMVSSNFLFRPIISIIIFLQIPIMYSTRGKFFADTRWGNITMWIGLMCGLPLIAILYAREYYFLELLRS